MEWLVFDAVDTDAACLCGGCMIFSVYFGLHGGNDLDDSWFLFAAI